MPRPVPFRIVAAAVLVGSILVGADAGGSTPTGASRSEGGLCALPVDAGVVDGFRPPAESWSSGNRGLAFGTRPGDPVRAVTDGVVGFAGPIAGAWYVTVLLDDGRDVTYSYLVGTSLHVGDVVAVGDVVGRASAEPFHLGYRQNKGYLDPTALVVDACDLNHAVLVPVPP